MKPTALIVGGSGFVGRHLARQLSDRYTVVATGRDRDIRDRDAMSASIQDANLGVIVNLAAITTVRETFAAPREAYEIGFTGLLNLFEALKARDFTGRFLQVSSSEVFGFPASDELPLTEGSPFRPMSPYAVAKAAGEMLCHQWSQDAAFEIFVARPFTHIGPGQSTRFAIARFAQHVAEIENGSRAPSIEVGNLHATRDLTDVRDTARAYDLILHRARKGAVFNVCSGREVVMRAVLDNLIRLSGRKIAVVENRDLVRDNEQQRLFGTYAALAAATDWAPEIPLETTLADMLAHFRNERASSSG